MNDPSLLNFSQVHLVSDFAVWREMVGWAGGGVKGWRGGSVGRERKECREREEGVSGGRGGSVGRERRERREGEREIDKWRGREMEKRRE